MSDQLTEILAELLKLRYDESDPEMAVTMANIVRRTVVVPAPSAPVSAQTQEEAGAVPTHPQGQVAAPVAPDELPSFLDRKVPRR